MVTGSEYERSRWHGQYLTNWAPEYKKVRRSKPQRFVLGLGFRVEVVPALAHGAMGVAGIGAETQAEAALVLWNVCPQLPLHTTNVRHFGQG